MFSVAKMNRTNRLRRVGKLCCHFARNYAYYSAGWENGYLKVKNPFWVNLNGNFIDICVLEWHKLFGDHNDKHHWKEVMHQDQTFKSRMFKSLNIGQADLDELHSSIKSYRDKFVAHLDSEEIMNIPKLEDALRMVCFYYQEVKIACDLTSDWPESLEELYKEHFNLAVIQYDKQT